MKELLTEKEITSLRSGICPKCNCKSLYRSELQEGHEFIYCAKGHYFYLSTGNPSQYLNYMPPVETCGC